ncbi:hypothetical protein VNO77_20868 [Canavalia gladiata]|uniref:Uncharacterized protein n=1 Tax=Canavalia gladiata TaxID=3824 RepID=A0AAN9QQZ6_CANGL
MPVAISPLSNHTFLRFRDGFLKVSCDTPAEVDSVLAGKRICGSQSELRPAEMSVVYNEMYESECMPASRSNLL